MARTRNHPKPRGYRAWRHMVARLTHVQKHASVIGKDLIKMSA